MGDAMSDSEFVNLYNTMPFGKDPIKETVRVDEHTLYIISFNGPDLLFTFYDMNRWSLETVEELIFEKKGKKYELRSN